MNLVFIGASRFGLRCLELACRVPGCKVTGVVTAPQTFAISYRPEGVNNVLYADVATFAADRGVPSRTLERSMSEPAMLDAVSAWRPDAFLVAGWYHMVPKSWRDLAPAYGLHASLLPDYSGGAPLVWAMINGETQTGITLFQMDEGVDSGPIVGQAEEPIYADDTIATLYARIEQRGLDLLADALPRLVDGSAVLQPQPAEGRRVMPQRSPEDGRIDWSADSGFLERFVRAQTRPYPGAFSVLDGARLTVWAAHALAGEGAGHPPRGSVLARGAARGVTCGDGVLMLDEIEVGGRILAGAEVAEMLSAGTCFAAHEGAST